MNVKIRCDRHSNYILNPCKVETLDILSSLSVLLKNSKKFYTAHQSFGPIEVLFFRDFELPPVSTCKNTLKNY